MAPTYSTEGGEVRLEKKIDIKKKLGRSLDYADAVVYGNWVRPRTVTPVRREPEKPQGVSLGYDYERQQPRDLLTWEQYLDRMMSPPEHDPLAGRYGF